MIDHIREEMYAFMRNCIESVKPELFTEGL
jgi:hypothetical protein